MYKESFYNYYIKDGEVVICFNGLTNFMMSMTIDEYNMFHDVKKDLISFQIHYPTLCDKLNQWGFLVENTMDELDVIRFKNKLYNFKSKTYHLILNPTLECNFKCWYCYESHSKGKMSEDVLARVYKHIDRKIELDKLDSFHLDWFGGEPLLYYDEIVHPISIYVKDKCIQSNIIYSSHITTNGYLLNRRKIDLMKDMAPVRLQITLDGDKQRHDGIRNQGNVSSFDKIINNICVVCEEVILSEIILRINYTDDTLNSDFKSVFESIPKKYRTKIMLSFNRVWQTNTYREAVLDNHKLMEIIELGRQLGYRTPQYLPFAIGSNNRCYMDSFNTVLINYNGKVYSCTGRDFVEQNVLGELKEDGSIVYNQEKIAMKYGNVPFENEMCLKCKYLPLCLGPCSQKMVECKKKREKITCVYHSSEISVETFIKDQYYLRKKNR